MDDVETGVTTLTMEAPGATDAQIARGVTAAEEIFAINDTTAEEVAEALSNREADELSGAFVPPELWLEGGPPEQVSTARDLDIADLWYVADDAAVAACYGNRQRPETAQLVLRYKRLVH